MGGGVANQDRQARPLRQVIAAVALANLLYFGLEAAVALAIRSVSLFADSADFFEDAAVNFLILLALGWSPKARARLGMALAFVLLLPALGMLWALWQKVAAPSVPEPVPLTLTGAGALLVNFGCALALARQRHRAGSITHAAFLSARNDVFANLAIIAAGLVTVRWPSIWPDLLVGLGIAAMNIDAAREVWQAARTEQAAQP